MKVILFKDIPVDVPKTQPKADVRMRRHFDINEARVDR